MAKRKKVNKMRRYLRVFKRNIKRLSLKRIWAWFKKNLKQHPFILALLAIMWINNAMVNFGHGKPDIASLLKFHAFLLGLWLGMVILSNLLKDKQKVKWYFKKRLVFFMLLFFPPLGLVFLWSGSKFKKATKITLTVVFGLVFIGIQVFYNRKFDKLAKKDPFERITEMVTKPKKHIFLKSLDKKLFGGLKFTLIPQKAKIKLAVSDIALRCSPGVVSIKTMDANGKEMGMGSGFIISKDGVIVTNFHVLESAYQIEVKIGEDIFKEAYLIKGISDLDIAMVKIEAKDLPALYIGDSDSLKSGQFVTVLGNPWGLERSVSNGIVGAIRSKGDIKLIQITAPVSPGSSGGPVINEYGEVVGITTLASSFIAQNLNFAIPINYLEMVLKEK